MSAKTRRKVERAAATLGYRPNALASSLTTGRTKLVGLVANNFHNPVFLEVFDLFTRCLQDRGLRPLLVNLTDETDPENSLNLLRQYSVDGVIVASSTLPPEFATAFRSAEIPVVHSFGRVSRTPDVHVVGIDNKECGRLAAKELARRGYRRVAFLGGPRDATSTQDRLAGFVEGCGGFPDLEMSHSFASAYSFEAGRNEMKELLSGKRAEAYFCGDDVLSIGAKSAIEDAGLRVPDDIGLIGLNDMEIAGWEGIGLTTIRQPLQDIIEGSVDLVVTLFDNPDLAPVARALPCHLVERNSLGWRTKT